MELIIWAAPLSKAEQGRVALAESPPRPARTDLPNAAGLWHLMRIFALTSVTGSIRGFGPQAASRYFGVLVGHRVQLRPDIEDGRGWMIALSRRVQYIIKAPHCATETSLRRNDRLPGLNAADIVRRHKPSTSQSCETTKAACCHATGQRSLAPPKRLTKPTEGSWDPVPALDGTSLLEARRYDFRDCIRD